MNRNLRWTHALIVALSIGCGAETRTATSTGLVIEPSTLRVELTPETPDISRAVSVRLRNANRSPIKILEIVTLCGCITAESLSNPVIARGQSVELKLHLQLPHRGLQRTTVSVITDSVETPRVDLPVELVGLEPTPPFVESAPDVFHLRGTGTSGSISRELTIQTFELAQSPPWLLRMKIDRSGIQAPDFVMSEEPTDDRRWVRRKYTTSIQAAVESAASAPAFATGYLVTSGTSEPESQTVRLVVETVPVLRMVPRTAFVRVPQAETNLIERRIVFHAADNTEPWSVSTAGDLPHWLTVAEVDLADDDQNDARAIVMQIDPSKLSYDDGKQTIQSVILFQATIDTSLKLELPVTIARDEPTVADRNN